MREPDGPIVQIVVTSWSAIGGPVDVPVPMECQGWKLEGDPRVFAWSADLNAAGFAWSGEVYERPAGNYGVGTVFPDVASARRNAAAAYFAAERETRRAG